jgi:hypothetical protein
MTELTVASQQTDRFHETETADRRTSHLIDEWTDATWRLPDTVAAAYGLVSPSRLVRSFGAPYDAPVTLNSPGFYLDRIYNKLQHARPTERPHIMRSASILLAEVYERQLADMRHDWSQGYFPRRGSIDLGGYHYTIYNHIPRFSFTGDVYMQNRRDARTGEEREWLVAEFDTSPTTDIDGDFVPHDPDTPITVLPSMMHEAYVGRELAVAHLRALHGSISPEIASNFAPHLQELITEEDRDAHMRRFSFASMARLAFRTGLK